jgi:uncharacterized protein (TIGR02246 family)
VRIDDSIEAARALVMTWVQIFNAHQLEQLAALYADDATLHGTSQARLYVGREQIRSYFRGTSTVKLGEQVWSRISDGVALCVGKYEFTRAQNEQQVVVPARFTFVLGRKGMTWRIVHHHSSTDPA